MAERSEALERWRQRLREAANAPERDADMLALSEELALWLFEASVREATPQEKARGARLAAMVDDRQSRAFTFEVTDQAFRSSDADRVADQVRALIGRHGVPGSLGSAERLMLHAFEHASGVTPGLSTALFRRYLRRETAEVVAPAEEPALTERLRALSDAGVQVNLNRLGESVLGRRHARERFDLYRKDLERPDVHCVSIKLSALDPHLDVLALDRSVEALSALLRPLFVTARAHPFVAPDGRSTPKRVYFDMESYDDLALVVGALQATLSDATLRDCHAGIALQAYLPESFALQRELTQWSAARVAEGAAPLRIRIVKGANLAMERVLAARSGHAQPTYRTKAAVDASFLRMVRFATEPPHAAAVHVGVATHNVFDVAYAAVLRAARGAEHAVGFEMLYGMNESLARAVQRLTGDLLIYLPVVSTRELDAAIAYLVRRFDENTGEQHYLRRSFAMVPDDAAWTQERERFAQSVALSERTDDLPPTFRTQDRRALPPPRSPAAAFANEPDTDWTVARHRAWIGEALARWHDLAPARVPVVVAGEAIERSEAGERPGVDPSRPGFDSYRTVLADWAHIDRALDVATQGRRAWEARGVEARAEVLSKVAQGLRERRADLIGCMVRDGARVVREADAEVSEAIDFAEYYPRSFAAMLDALAGGPGEGLVPRARGVVAVLPPWNFPLAIPAGGTLAALMAGNAVVLKPAPETTWVAWELAKVLWDAGVPPEALSFVPCAEEPTGARLLRDERLDAVVLTGASTTARWLRALRPELPVFAETGGKNAMIVTAMADRDLAIDAVMRSAFSHAGQKCSAASQLVCEAEVYDDRGFMDRLRDAAASLPTGSAWDLSTRVPPLIRPPDGPLERALTSLETGERWLLEPRRDADNPCLVTPAIRADVAPGSASHRVELFGPVLSVLRARDLDDALRIANGTDYGLTAGLCSLDLREHARFEEAMEAGNLYINRSTVGAIVRRQPFGGRKASSFGPGAKAGGPNYVAQLVRWSEGETAAGGAKHAEPGRVQPLGALAASVRTSLNALLGWLGDLDARSSLSKSAASYAWWWERYFMREHDPSMVLGERNVFRYRPREVVHAWAGVDSAALDIARVIIAAKTCRVRLELAHAPRAPLRFPALASVESVSAGELHVALAERRVKTLLVLGRETPALRAEAASGGVWYDATPPHPDGRVELLRYLREQSVCAELHRYGHLPDTAAEPPEGL